MVESERCLDRMTTSGGMRFACLRDKGHDGLHEATDGWVTTRWAERVEPSSVIRPMLTFTPPQLRIYEHPLVPILRPDEDERDIGGGVIIVRRPPEVDRPAS